MSCRVITCNLCESPAVTWFGDHLILLIEHALQEPIYNASGEALEDANTAGSKFWEGVKSNSVESDKRGGFIYIAIRNRILRTFF